MRLFTRRLARVLRFEPGVYRDLASDPSAAVPAVLIVLAATVLGAAGQLAQGGFAVAVAVVFFFFGFFIFAGLVMVGARAMQGRTDYGRVVRTLGFAYLWLALGALGFLPGIGPLLTLVSLLATLAASVVAAREAALLDTGRAALTVATAGVVALLLSVVVSTPIMIRLFPR